MKGMQMIENLNSFLKNLTWSCSELKDLAYSGIIISHHINQVSELIFHIITPGAGVTPYILAGTDVPLEYPPSIGRDFMSNIHL